MSHLTVKQLREALILQLVLISVYTVFPFFIPFLSTALTQQLSSCTHQPAVKPHRIQCPPFQ